MIRIVFLFAAFVTVASPAFGADRPNILWLIAEDLSPDLGCYGTLVVKTPHLDALAASGVRYTHMFTASPVCSPSRTALAVGTMQTTIGAFHMRYPAAMRPPLPDGVKTIAELMQDAGYATANFGYRGGKFGGKGKDDWMFAPSKRKPWTLSKWEQLNKNQPFFAQVNFQMTHRAWVRDPKRPVDPAKVKLPPYYPDDAITRDDWAGYLESLQVLDRQVADVLAKLKASGLNRNTIVVFIGDHGRPFTRGKTFCYDSGLRVPFIVHVPEGIDAPAGYEAGTVSDRMLVSLDLTATTLALAGVARPKWMQGQVFLGEGQHPPRDAVYAAVDRVGEIEFQTRTIRTRRYRYLRNERHGFSVNEASTAYRKAMHPIYHVLRKWDREGRLNAAQRTLVDPLPREQLFDVTADPYEVKNLANDPEHARVLAGLRARLDKWISKVGDQGRSPDLPEIIEAFAEYGRKGAKSRAAAIERQRLRVEQPPRD